MRVGFNHRYHPALQKARELVDAGALGPLMFVRGRYGHGGRVGYDREWRADPALSGGGELIDQGVHLIDLARWFLGDFIDGRRLRRDLLLGHAGRRQRASCCCARRAAQAAFLHVSCTEWKNLFSLEIYGRDGKLADRRPRRQLRRRAARVLQDAARDGTARDHDLGVSRAATGRGRSSSRSSSTTSGCGRDAVGRPRRRRAPRWPSSRRSTASRATTAGGRRSHDHHAQPAADHARRRRHRPAVLLPRARRLPDRRGDRQVRLRHGHAAVRRRASS